MRISFLHPVYVLHCRQRDIFIIHIQRHLCAREKLRMYYIKCRNRPVLTWNAHDFNAKRCAKRKMTSFPSFPGVLSIFSHFLAMHSLSTPPNSCFYVKPEIWESDFLKHYFPSFCTFKSRVSLTKYVPGIILN